jgi:hypothetical protein
LSSELIIDVLREVSVAELVAFWLAVLKVLGSGISTGNKIFCFFSFVIFEL